MHEADLTAYIKSLAANGAADFLIDIGANIGMTSCQNGNDFSQVICFEPNPLCVHILKVNTEICLDASKVKIWECGLGKEASELELWVPKHNWGGGFVRNENNTYSNETLAKKDGFSKFDKKTI